jgi:hypothetical protein
MEIPKIMQFLRFKNIGRVQIRFVVDDVWGERCLRRKRKMFGEKDEDV